MKKHNRQSRAVFLAVAAQLNGACTTLAVEMDAMKPVVNREASAHASEDVVVVLNEQVRELQADGTRIYWTAQPKGGSCGADAERAALRSCAVADCAATLVTYAEGPNFCVSRDLVDIQDRSSASSTYNGTGMFTINAERIYWGKEFVSCPLAGCEPALDLAISGPITAEHVLAERLYWLNSSNPYGLQRCVPDDCNETVETLTEFDEQAAVRARNLVLDSTHAYWVLGNEIRRITLDGPILPEVVATTASAPGSLTIANDHVYWTNGAFPTAILRCSVTGSSTTPPAEVLAFATYPSWTAVIGSWLFWTHTNEVNLEVDIRHCNLEDCSGSTKSLEPTAQRILGHWRHGNNLYYGTSTYDGGTTTIHRQRF